MKITKTLLTGAIVLIIVMLLIFSLAIGIKELITPVLTKIGVSYSNLSGELRLAVLIITAIIVGFYAYETYKLREIEQKRLKKERKPLVNLSVGLGKREDINIISVELSGMWNANSTLLRVSYNIVKEGKELKNERKVIDRPGYKGERFWNLQLSQSSHGLFNWMKCINIYKTVQDKEKKEKGKRLYEIVAEALEEELGIKIDQKDIKDCSIKLRLYFEYFCVAKTGEWTYYPEKTWDYNIFYPTRGRKLIARLVSSQAFWEHEEPPQWIKKNDKVKEFLKKNKTRDSL